MAKRRRRLIVIVQSKSQLAVHADYTSSSPSRADHGD